MIRLLHRGNTRKFLENSIEAISSTINCKNFNGLEIDIRLTKDKKWIIYHENGFKFVERNYVDGIESLSQTIWWDDEGNLIE